jgi:hypothetical protein
MTSIHPLSARTNTSPTEKGSSPDRPENAATHSRATTSGKTLPSKNQKREVSSRFAHTRPRCGSLRFAPTSISAYRFPSLTKRFPREAFVAAREVTQLAAEQPLPQKHFPLKNRKGKRSSAELGPRGRSSDRPRPEIREPVDMTFTMPNRLLNGRLHMDGGLVAL